MNEPAALVDQPAQSGAAAVEQKLDELQQESDKLKKKAWQATQAWLALVAVYTVINQAVVLCTPGAVEMIPLNEMGDFLAGVTSPLAFLWLVVGYYQQGHELRQNTSALQLQGDQLKLQVQELQLSVEQQRQMAVAAKEANSMTRQTLDHERDRRIRAEQAETSRAQPTFVVRESGHPVAGHEPRAPHWLRQHFNLENTGAPVTNLSFICVQEGFAEQIGRNVYKKCDHLTQMVLYFDFDPDGPLQGDVRIRADYCDEHRDQRWQDFLFSLDRNACTIKYTYVGCSFDPNNDWDPEYGFDDQPA